MNKEVMKELQKKIKQHADEKVAELKQNLLSKVKPSEHICTEHRCLDEIDKMIRDVHLFLANMAIEHGIDPHDAIKETLTVMLEGNEYARTVQATAKAFKDDETVGFC